VSALTQDPKAIKAAIEEVTKEAAPQVTTVAPSNSDVILPCGFITQEGTLVKYAEVRELNGSDEEAIAKAGGLGRVLTTILQRGLVSLGGEKVRKEDLDDLLAADRDAILLAIRRVTFGEVADYQFTCTCGVTSIVGIDLNEDIPTKVLKDPVGDRNWEVQLKNGTAILTLPTGYVQRLLTENADKTSAELNTILLEGCVLSVNGKASLGASTVLKLGMQDRETIINEILDKNPGPRLGEVKKNCEACGASIDTPVSLVALFRL